MKRLLFCLMLASAAQMLPMEPEETATAKYLSDLPLNEMLVALEEHDARFEVSMKDHEEKLEQIQDHHWYGDISPMPFILNVHPNRTEKQLAQGVDELCLSIELANAYKAKVQSYLDNKEAKKEQRTADELRVLNPRVYLNPIIEMLLLSDNPKRGEAIKTIILNAHKYCYSSPLDMVYVYEIYPYLRPDKFVKFLKEAGKPGSATDAMTKFEKKEKLGNVGYLISKLDLPGPAKDRIFTYVLSPLLEENKGSLKSSLFKLSISDLAKFRSNIPSLELPHHLYEQDLNKASRDLGYVMKRLGATYDHNNDRHDFETLTPKRLAFDEHIRPIMTELLPGYNLDAPDNNELDKLF